MPEIFYTRRLKHGLRDGTAREHGSGHERLVTRKEFLRQVSIWTLGGATWLRLSRGAGAGEPATWTVAFLADTHIPADAAESYRGFRPVDNLQAVVPQVLGSHAEIAFLAGDAARLEGLRGDYERLRELIAPVAEQIPVVIGLGNHDDRANFFAVFSARNLPGARQNVPGKHVTVVEHPVARIVMLDSLLYVNRVAGLLGKAQRQWLERWLPAVADRPVILMVHHTLGDSDFDLLDTDRLLRIVRPHRHVKAVVYGHSHRYQIKQEDDLQLVNIPACGYNFSDDQPVGWTLAEIDSEGMTLTLHAIGGNLEGDGGTRRVAWLR